MIVGYLVLAFAPSLFMLSCALGIISVGTGLLKSNTSSYLGTFYEREDPRREQGFTVFYAGINIGSMLGNIFSGILFLYAGSQISFCVAAFGVMLGTALFYLGFKKLNLKLVRSVVDKKSWVIASVITLVAVIISTFVIYNPKFSLLFFSLVTILSIVFIFQASKDSKEQIKRSVAYLIFLAIAVIFWGIYNQMFLSMNLFIDRLVDHHILGIPMTTQSFIVANNIGVILFGFSVLRLWRHISDSKKYMLGMFLLSLVFMIVVAGIDASSAYAKIAAYWVIMAYLMLSLSELCISPIGLSLATKLAPRNKIGTFMGLWLVTSGIGGYVAGVIAKYAAIQNQHSNIELLKATYKNAFNHYIGIAIAAFIVTLLLGYIIGKLVEKPSRAQA
ncbi:hypothetical protein BGC07_01735 [Piscirickettsia litoralis]|uniref:Major facilitator superfamily (MFS) profile domain-containing protein n=1 Tax=Piscirickettsia litoralis TaxID=1891921 RepID=A0ABX3A3H0_9GAMM|nr:hypothetical protein BGC07_01735 [Piscirickettsia litoralis]